MKKITLLVLFGLLCTAGFSQLKVTVVHDGSDFLVEFPGGNTIEYKVTLYDPINPGSLELQQGQMGPADAAKVRWAADLRLIYGVSYRYALDTGELSEWHSFDPKEMLDGEGK